MPRRFSARDGFAEARAIYASGDNVTHALKAKYPDPEGFTDIVRVAYDLQSGTYVAALAQPGMAARKQAMARRILRLHRRAARSQRDGGRLRRSHHPELLGGGAPRAPVVWL
jgi:hypothetical protein